MALKSISFTVWWYCACDEAAYHGFNLVMTLCGEYPEDSPIERIYVKPAYSANGVYSYVVNDYIYDDTKCYDIWIQAVTYNGKESMWRNVAGIEIPDGAGDGLGSVTTEDVLDALDGATIDGEITDIINIDGGDILDGTITGDQIGDGTITGDQIGDRTINGDHIITDTITSNHIQAGTITADHIQANSITAIHIQSETITAGHIQANSIASIHIQSETIMAGHIQANSILTEHLSSGSITANHLQSHIIQAGHIEAGTITAYEIAAGTITGDRIHGETITAAQIAAETITGDRIHGETITAAQIAAETITGDKIYGGTINATHVDVDSLLSVNAEVTGTLTVTGSGQITLGNGNILASGSIVAASGSVGGWLISADKIESAVGTANRITLDKTLSRISIVSDTSATKVAMGYLSGLPKNDGSGNYTAGDYGFYAAPGDTLHIDGDAEYTSGDWIIQHDSAYLINDASGKTIVRLGSANGSHGIHIYNTTGTKLAEYSASKILIGTEVNGVLTSGLRYTVAGGLNIVGNITVAASNVTGLGSLATQNSVSTSQVSGLGTLATQSSVTTGQVTGLGSLATQSSVTTSQVTGLGTLATKNTITSSSVTDLGSLATMDSVSNSYITSIDGGKISTGTIAANRIASNQTFIGHTIQSSSFSDTSKQGWSIKSDGKFTFYGGGGRYIKFDGTTMSMNVPISVSQVTGLGSLATQSSVTTGQVTGLGTLATKNTITSSSVTDLGSLATMDSVSNSYITSIDGGKISTGTITLKSSGTSVRINSGGKIGFYPYSTEAGYITTSSSNTMELNSTGRILIQAGSLIQINSSGSINLAGSSLSVGSASTFNGNITISGTRTLTGASTSVSVSSLATSGTVTAGGNVFAPGLVIGTYGMDVSRGQPKRLTTRSVATSYIDFDYSSSYIKIAANGGTMVNAVAYSSDYRLKENMIPLEQESVINLMDSVQPYKFNFIGQSNEEYGVLAQDLAEIFPECVCEMHDGYFGVNYHMLTTLLIDCVRNLNARVKELEAT